MIGRKWWEPWLWLSPALLLLSVFLVYPVLNTFVTSFMDADSSGGIWDLIDDPDKFVGLDNYEFIIDNPRPLVSNTHAALLQQRSLADRFHRANRTHWSPLRGPRGTRSVRIGGQVIDLHPDGDLFRRRIRHLAVHVRVQRRRRHSKRREDRARRRPDRLAPGQGVAADADSRMSGRRQPGGRSR